MASPIDVNRALVVLDTSKDWKIQAGELPAATVRKLDGNGDGQLDWGELDAGFERAASVPGNEKTFAAIRAAQDKATAADIKAFQARDSAREQGAGVVLLTGGGCVVGAVVGIGVVVAEAIATGSLALGLLGPLGVIAGAVLLFMAIFLLWDYFKVGVPGHQQEAANKEENRLVRETLPKALSRLPDPVGPMPPAPVASRGVRTAVA